MYQKLKCNVCGKDFNSWMEFVTHFIEEHPEKFYEGKVVDIRIFMDSAEEKKLRNNARVNYDIANLEIIPWVQDKVIILAISKPIDDVAELARTAEKVRNFVHDIGAEKSELIFVRMQRTIKPEILEILRAWAKSTILGRKTVIDEILGTLNINQEEEGERSNYVVVAAVVPMAEVVVE